MNLSELITSFRVDSDDVAAPHLWDEEEVIRWFNEAVDEAAIRKKLIFDKSNPLVTKIQVTASTGSVYKLHPRICEIVYASITDSAGCVKKLYLTDREAMDDRCPDWRTQTKPPEYIIHRDNTIEVACIPDGSYTINLETHRLPLCDMEDDDDSPEIHPIHHRFLVHWVLHRAYQKPDSQTLNPGKAESALKAFEDYFGLRPDADQRKDQNAEKPHHHRAYW